MRERGTGGHNQGSEMMSDRGHMRKSKWPETRGELDFQNKTGNSQNKKTPDKTKPHHCVTLRTLRENLWSSKPSHSKALQTKTNTTDLTKCCWTFTYFSTNDFHSAIAFLYRLVASWSWMASPITSVWMTENTVATHFGYVKWRKFSRYSPGSSPGWNKANRTMWWRI